MAGSLEEYLGEADGAKSLLRVMSAALTTMDENYAKKNIQSSKNELENIIGQKVNLLSF
jgi:hypothetical protein